MNKTIFPASAKRLFMGIKKAHNTPILPENILKIQNYLSIRIIRVLGGISVLTILLGRAYFHYPIYVYYIALFFCFIFLIYRIIISYFTIKHIIKILKSDELDIRNSPLEKLATIGASAWGGWKGACDTAQPIGVSLSDMIGIDEILKSSGR
nr:hypothetical protein [Taiwanofungus camphoratus]WRO45222.1 hypothetical protein [Taiwanofungus sp. YW-2023a]